jgi:hypothetical protein
MSCPPQSEASSTKIRASALDYIPFTGLTARMDATAEAKLRSAKPLIIIAHIGTWRHMRARRRASL